MRRFTKSKLADADLIDIWAYSFEQWGAARADKYIDDIFTVFETIPINSELGVGADFIKEAYRKFLVGSHVIFYCEEGVGLKIVRILNQTMDVSLSKFDER